MGCDVNSLVLPENAKAWHNNNNAKKWELECELNYEIERVSKRDFHRCKSDNTWASPNNVVVKCRFSSEAVHREIQELKKLEEKLESIAEQMSEDRKIAVDMAEKMVEERKMSEQMAAEISENLNITREINAMMKKPDGEKPLDESLIDSTPGNNVEGRGPVGDPTDTAILVLNTKPFAAKPLTFDLNANVDENLDFEYVNLAGAFFGCAVTFNNMMFYFGGVGADSRQISRVKDCTLTRDTTQDLPFDFEGGTCNVFPDPNSSTSKEIVYLCFGDKENKKCRTYDMDGNFNLTAVPDTTYEHSFVQLASYKKRPFVTGSFESLKENNNRTEFLVDGNNWSEAPEYPDATFIAFYSTVSTDESVYIIGGRRESQVEQEQQYTDVVAQFTKGAWKIAQQQLLYQRVGHASILLEYQERQVFFIFGGSVRDADGETEDTAVTELWELTDDGEPKLFDGEGLNPYRDPYVKSRDYQFGIALYKINSTTIETPNYCAKLL